MIKFTTAFWLLLLVGVTSVLIVDTGDYYASGFIFLCAIINLFKPALEYLTNKSLLRKSRPLSPEKIEITPEFLRYTDSSGDTSTIKWNEIERVVWSKPDWGYGMSGSDPYWSINEINIFVTSHSSEDSQNLLAALSRTLPDFDPQCVKKAVDSGYLDNEENSFIECWRRFEGEED